MNFLAVDVFSGPYGGVLAIGLVMLVLGGILVLWSVVTRGR